MHEIRKVQNSPNKMISESSRRWLMGLDEPPTMALKHAIEQLFVWTVSLQLLILGGGISACNV